MSIWNVLFLPEFRKKYLSADSSKTPCWQRCQQKVNNIRITNVYFTCLPTLLLLSSSRQQLLPRVGRPAIKPLAQRAPLTIPSSAPKVLKRDATGEEKWRRRAKGVKGRFLNPSHRTVWRKLASASLWMQTSSTMTWKAHPHIRFSMICQYDLSMKYDILLYLCSLLNSKATFVQLFLH